MDNGFGQRKARRNDNMNAEPSGALYVLAGAARTKVTRDVGRSDDTHE